MINHADATASTGTGMDAYEQRAWDRLNEHWQRHAKRYELPQWLSDTRDRTWEVTRRTADRASDALPQAISDPVRRVGERVSITAVEPALKAAASLLELFNDWALELNDPASVEKLARKRGIELDNFMDLRQQHLRVCDRLLTHHTLTWRTAGAFEGGGMGLLAMVPVAGIPVAIGADVLVVQVMSLAIASRTAYSYGFDAKDPDELEFIQRLVRRAFFKQASKVEPLREAAQAANALKNRVNWSAKLREEQRLVAVLEKLMKQLSPAGARISVQDVAKVVPIVGVVVGAGMNSTVLAKVASDAQRYCQTRSLCDKYDLPLPTALRGNQDEDLDGSAP